jgi:two-component system, LytTR family, response regulator
MAPEGLNLKCLVVDDEPLARQVLEHHVRRHAGLSLAGICSSAAQAIEMLQRVNIGLMFIDVRMPRESGIELVRAIAHPPAVIFTTAHSEYAVEAFALQAVDYLVKPIAFDRFAEAVSRVLFRSNPVGTPATTHLPGPSQSIFVRVNHRLLRIPVMSIEFVEACENYVQFHTAHKTYLTKRTMKEVESLLGVYGFVRVHRSFLVNVRLIDHAEAAALRVSGKVIPMSRSGREAMLRLLPMV